MSEFKGDADFMKKCTAIYTSSTGVDHVWVVCRHNCDKCGFSKSEVARRKSLIKNIGLKEKSTVVINADGSKRSVKRKRLMLREEI